MYVGTPQNKNSRSTVLFVPALSGNSPPVPVLRSRAGGIVIVRRPVVVKFVKIPGVSNPCRTLHEICPKRTMTADARSWMKRRLAWLAPKGNALSALDNKLGYIAHSIVDDLFQCAECDKNFSMSLAHGPPTKVLVRRLLMAKPGATDEANGEPHEKFSSIFASKVSQGEHISRVVELATYVWRQWMVFSRKS